MENVMNQYVSAIQILVLLFSVILTQIVAAWIGKRMAQSDEDAFQYAYFVFLASESKPITGKILLNFFAPIISMVLLYDVFSYICWTNLLEYLWLYPAVYFVWRMILICVFLNRRELYNLIYEILVAVPATGLSFMIFKCILSKTDSILNRPEDLRMEFGIALILTAYSFIKFIIEKNIFQTDIISDNKKSEYIIRKYNEFKKKYDNTVKNASLNGVETTVLYSIMIYEDFNRGRFVRILEYLLFLFRKNMSLGIMQVQTQRIIGDEESILLAGTKIKQCYELVQEYAPLDDCVREIAGEYNPDDRYIDNIEYIYRVIEGYVETEADRRVDSPPAYMGCITCNSWRELSSALADGYEYLLKCTDGDILSDIDDSRYLQVQRVGDEWEVIIRDLHNVVIDGSGSHFFSRNKTATIIKIVNCRNVVLKNFKIGHKAEIIEGCGADLEISESTDVCLSNLELYGCGTYALYVNYSDVTLTDSVIHNCRNGAVYGKCGAICLINSQILDCGGETNSIIKTDNLLELKDAEIANNTTNDSIIEVPAVGCLTCKNVYVHDNEYRKNYYLLNSSAGVRLENNKQLPW